MRLSDGWLENMSSILLSRLGLFIWRSPTKWWQSRLKIHRLFWCEIFHPEQIKDPHRQSSSVKCWAAVCGASGDIASGKYSYTHICECWELIITQEKNNIFVQINLTYLYFYFITVNLDVHNLICNYRPALCVMLLILLMLFSLWISTWTLLLYLLRDHVRNTFPRCSHSGYIFTAELYNHIWVFPFGASKNFIFHIENVKLSPN